MPIKLKDTKQKKLKQKKLTIGKHILKLIHLLKTKTKADINISNKAFYSPNGDFIGMPPK